MHPVTARKDAERCSSRSFSWTLWPGMCWNGSVHLVHSVHWRAQYRVARKEKFVRAERIRPRHTVACSGPGSISRDMCVAAAGYAPLKDEHHIRGIRRGCHAAEPGKVPPRYVQQDRPFLAVNAPPSTECAGMAPRSNAKRSMRNRAAGLGGPHAPRECRVLEHPRAHQQAGYTTIDPAPVLHLLRRVMGGPEAPADGMRKMLGLCAGPC